MKAIISFALLIITCCSLISCSNNNSNGILNDPEIKTFSYDQHQKSYLSGESGGIAEGFKNITKKPIENKQDAINLAKNEVTIKYNDISVYYDDRRSMWMIVFSTKGAFDGCQNIYIDKDGVTKLIVDGG